MHERFTEGTDNGHQELPPESDDTDYPVVPVPAAEHQQDVEIRLEQETLPAGDILETVPEAGDAQSEQMDLREQVKQQAEAAVQAAYDFAAAYGNLAEPLEPPGQAAAEDFTRAMRDFAGCDAGSRSCSLLGEIILQTASRESREPDGAVSRFNETTFSLWRPESPVTAPADIEYSLTRAEGPAEPDQTIHKHVLFTGMSGIRPAVEPSKEELLAFAAMAQTVQEASDQLNALPNEPGKEAAPQCKHVETAEGADYGSNDVERLAADHPALLRPFSCPGPVTDPARPEYWLRANQTRRLLGVRGPRRFDANHVAEHVAAVREEHAKLADLGATIPPHAHLVVEGVEADPVILTAAKNAGDGQTLASPHNSRTPLVDDELVPQQLHVASMICDYLTACIDNEDRRHLWDIAHPRQWGREGELYDLDPYLTRGLPSLQTQFRDLSNWVRYLPDSPQRTRLNQRIRSQIIEIKRIADSEDITRF